MSVKQISVFLENKPGTLAKMTALLAEGGVALRALNLAETKDFGIVRIIVDDSFRAANILKEADHIATFTPVLAYMIPDEVGGLNKLLTYFTEAGVNIEYMYAFLGAKTDGLATMIFRVDDTEAAEAALAARGLRCLTQDEIENL